MTTGNYATESRCWYTKNEIIEIKAADRKDLIEQCERNSFIKVKYCN